MEYAEKGDRVSVYAEVPGGGSRSGRGRRKQQKLDDPADVKKA